MLGPGISRIPTPTSQTRLGAAQCTEFIQICCQLGFKISVHLTRSCHHGAMEWGDEFPASQWDMALSPFFPKGVSGNPSLCFFKKNRMELFYFFQVSTKLHKASTSETPCPNVLGSLTCRAACGSGSIESWLACFAFHILNHKPVYCIILHT